MTVSVEYLVTQIALIKTKKKFCCYSPPEKAIPRGTPNAAIAKTFSQLADATINVGMPLPTP